MSFLSDNHEINSLKYDNLMESIAKEKGISMEKAKQDISEMKFSDYLRLLEASNIIPPSGQTITPTTQPTQNAAPVPGASNKPVVSWPGKGTPMQSGMTVGVKGSGNMPVPGEITQVDQGAKGVKIKNPTTNQEEWYNDADVQPYMTGAQGQMQQQPQQTNTQVTAEDVELTRMKTLAGITETASCGGTSAGAIATAPASMGVKRREKTDEEIPTMPKTIVGDTKPNQASSKLSNDLVKRKLKSAGRKDNGIQR
jgi:hypothetical protein